MEVWKDVKGYKGLYQVSNSGRVKSLDQKWLDKRGRKRHRKGKILKQFKGNIKYLKVTLSKKSKIKSFMVHQLVAMAFLNHKPCGHKKIIDHINNIKTDNRLTNLQIITARHNSSKDQKNRSSKYVGVCWHKTYKKWISYIKINGKLNFLGYHKNEYKAHLAYQKALKDLL